MKNFIDCNWLNSHLEDAHLFVVDCRFDLFDPSYGKKAYSKGHIKDAYYLDINEDLSGPQKRHGGARPMPDIPELVKKLESLGITTDATIVFYDDTIISSSRAWWQFKYLGFKNVYILNGGFQTWKQLDLPTTTDVPAPRTQGKIEVTLQQPIYLTMADVKQALQQSDTILVDAREEQRYTGEYEPLYAQKGHIPTALNVPCDINITADGQLADHPTLEKNFSHIEKSHDVISYCGSGINGALNFAILDELGYKVSLYVGSVSDWITYEENCLSTGFEK
ncbi:MAG: sulfurtransferase [Clostridia bacterium]|nr:sulfurtransferase [Clostridia bacterium]